MKFRDMRIDDVILIGPYNRNDFIKVLKKLHRKYIVIDLQYSSVIGDNMLINDDTVLHSALALVRNK